MAKQLKGKRFHSMVADCCCLWEVKRSCGRGIFECEVVNEPVEVDGETYDGDFAGRTEVFTRAQIEQKLRLEDFHLRLRDGHEDFYASLGHEQVVHYDYGGGAYIRCHVVMAGPRHDLDHAEVVEGERCLKIVALVGDWRGYDLRPDSYHAKRIGRLFKPNASCIWENTDAPCRKRGVDPRHMEILLDGV